MSSFTAADLKLGGRLQAACDAMGEGHLRRAAGIFNEIADGLNMEAEATTGLLAPDEPLPNVDTDDWAVPLEPQSVQQRMQAVAQRAQAEAVDLQACARNVHSYGAPDPISGWRTCSACGYVNVAGPGGGPVDLGSGR